MTPRFARLARALQGSEGAIGAASLVLAFGLLAMMLIRVVAACGPAMKATIVASLVP